MNRRGFLQAILAAGVAPAVIGSGILMPVRRVFSGGDGISLTTIAHPGSLPMPPDMFAMQDWDMFVEQDGLWVLIGEQMRKVKEEVGLRVLNRAFTIMVPPGEIAIYDARSTMALADV